MHRNRGILLLAGLGYLLTPLTLKSKSESHNHFHLEHDNIVKKESAPVYEENVQTFDGPAGKHKLYWAQGINAPKMTYKEEEYGKPGFFDKEYLPQDKSTTYQAVMEPGNGYYDLNKNLSRMHNPTHIGDESSHCYLYSAGNLAYWWLEQNKDLVTEYLTRLKTTDIYGQVDGLTQVYPFDQAKWERFYKAPYEAEINNLKRQEGGKSDLITEGFKPYYQRYFDGFVEDKPLDFFINGYQSDAEYPGDSILPPNNPDDFKKDPQGGYFYDIFENYKLTERFASIDNSSFSWYEENLKKFFNEGKALILGYRFMGGNAAHAITIWGAEYDDNGHLLRIFVTDSDDIDNSVPNKKGYTRGLHSMNMKKNPDNGKVILGNNPSATVGVTIQTVSTLSLGRDKFQARLDDSGAPIAPEITFESDDRVYGKGGTYKIKVEGTIKDTGTIGYQWYETSKPSEEGVLIKGATKNTFDIPTDEVGVKYYYCELLNQKNGKITSTKSKVFKADVQNIELVHAQMPNVRFNDNTVKVKQFHEPPRLFVNASIQDKGNLTYQWYEARDNSATNGRLIPGATQPYFYPPVTESRNLFYYCVVTNTNTSDEVTGNQVTSWCGKTSKRIIVEPSSINETQSPLIMKHPSDATYNQGDKILPLEVDAKSYDGGTISYQWNEVESEGNLKPIVGENSQSFTPKIQNPGTKIYACEVTNTNSKFLDNPKKSLLTRNVYVTINGEVSLSDDNKLNSLTVSNATISPSFDKDINNYSANVAHNINKLDVVATANSGAKVTINNPELNYDSTTNVVIDVLSESGLLNTYTIVVTRSSEHIFGDWEIVNDSDCKNTGLKRRTCSGCGYVEEEIIPLKDHSFGDWVVIKQPTEEEQGIKERTCNVCGEKETSFIPCLNHVHEFGEWVVTKPATCAEEGIETRECKCGEKETRTIPKLAEHTFGPWIVRTPSTETTHGIEYRVCEVCGIEETRELPLLEHIHEFGEWVVVKEPTTTENGLEQRTCRCGETETREIPKLDEPIIQDPEKPNDDNPSQVNVGAIIAGVSVPVILIATIGIVIFVFKRKL